jgi:hypothetical protein
VKLTTYANRIKRPVADAPPQSAATKAELGRVARRPSYRPLSYRDHCLQKMATAQQYGTKFGRIESLPVSASNHPAAR